LPPSVARPTASRTQGSAQRCRPGSAGPVGVYKPRRAQASPLFRLVQDHFRTLQTLYDERSSPTYDASRPVVREVADKFPARAPCDGYAHEYPLAFSCKARYFRPSCHAKRLRLWTLWLERLRMTGPLRQRSIAPTSATKYNGQQGSAALYTCARSGLEICHDDTTRNFPPTRWKPC